MLDNLSVTVEEESVLNKSGVPKGGFASPTVLPMPPRLTIVLAQDRGVHWERSSA